MNWKSWAIKAFALTGGISAAARAFPANKPLPAQSPTSPDSAPANKIFTADNVHFSAKMGIAPAGAAIVAAATANTASKLKPWQRKALLILGMVGTNIGDYFMYKTDEAENALDRRFLRRGAAGFAGQQAALLATMGADRVRFQARKSLPTAAWMLGLAAVDTVVAARTAKKTGQSQPPPDPIVFGYGLLLGAMAALAASSSPQYGWKAVTGGLLFLVSDSAIIGQPLLPAGKWQRADNVFIMSTYVAGLGLLLNAISDGPQEIDSAEN